MAMLIETDGTKDLRVNDIIWTFHQCITRNATGHFKDFKTHIN